MSPKNEPKVSPLKGKKWTEEAKAKARATRAANGTDRPSTTPTPVTAVGKLPESERIADAVSFLKDMDRRLKNLEFGASPRMNKEMKVLRALTILALDVLEG